MINNTAAQEGDRCSNVVGPKDDDVCGEPGERRFFDDHTLVAVRCHRHRWKDIRPGSDKFFGLLVGERARPPIAEALKSVEHVTWDGAVVPSELLPLYEKPMLPSAAKLVAQIAESKGFDRCTWENLPIKLMFVMTEVEEALKELDVYPAQLLPAEMADIAIRTLAILGTLWPDDWNSSRIEGGSQRKDKVPDTHRESASLFRPIQAWLCKAIGYWRNDNKRDTMQCLEFSLLELFRLADALGIDLNDAIRAKCAKNLGRPRRHGKVRSEG